MLLASVSRDFRDFCSSVKLRSQRCTPCLCVILQAHHHKNISSERIKKNNITQTHTQTQIAKRNQSFFFSLCLPLFACCPVAPADPGCRILEFIVLFLFLFCAYYCFALFFFFFVKHKKRKIDYKKYIPRRQTRITWESWARNILRLSCGIAGRDRFPIDTAHFASFFDCIKLYQAVASYSQLYLLHPILPHCSRTLRPLLRYKVCLSMSLLFFLPFVHCSLCAHILSLAQNSRTAEEHEEAQARTTSIYPKKKKNSKKKKKLSEMFQKFISQEWKECAIY